MCEFQPRIARVLYTHNQVNEEESSTAKKKKETHYMDIVGFGRLSQLNAKIFIKRSNDERAEKENNDSYKPLVAKWNVNENCFSICLFSRKQIFRFTSIDAVFARG